MASKIASGSNLPAGGTHYWYWNNAVYDQVYTFAAKPLSQGYPAGEKQAKIASVKYIMTPHFDAPATTAIQIEVYNPGSTSVNYDLFILSA
jgi:hypothetical protein